MGLAGRKFAFVGEYRGFGGQEGGEESGVSLNWWWFLGSVLGFSLHGASLGFKPLHIARVGGVFSLFFLRMASSMLGWDRYRLECFIVSYLEGRKIIVLIGNKLIGCVMTREIHEVPSKRHDICWTSEPWFSFFSDVHRAHVLALQLF